MNIGDKVRLLHASEEGRIVGFKDKNIVEIETADGFVVPVLKSDVVLIAREEMEYFGDKPSAADTSRAAAATPVKKVQQGFAGTFLAYIPVNENDISLYLLNLTGKDLMFNVSETHGGNCKSYAHGTVQPGNNAFITYLKMADFEKWPEIWVQLIFINHRLDPKTGSYESFIKLKAKSFFNARKTVPGINKEGYLVEVKNLQDRRVDAQELKNSLSKEKEENLLSVKPQRKNVQLTVDLHIEKLTPKPAELKADAIIELQLNTFEKELDNAIVSGAESVKFIHGIGNGALRQRLHKYLSQAENISYFEDADKGKFGYGATTVHL